ncbi:hypothetical protein BH23VER1_BH23VER1_10890 [soil metagenome]
MKRPPYRHLSTPAAAILTMGLLQASAHLAAGQG